MAKSKKKKQKDFQKVKLKVGKRLKKADNVTNAAFRTRSVQIAQKLKTAGSEPSTRKNLNINDLLSQCQHYNSTVRLDAVTGLQELMTSYPDLLSSHISVILERLSELFTDKEAQVRKAVIKLFKLIFTRIPSQKVQPFFSVISAYLCCAITHIQNDIQLDSLSIFDLLLENFPVFVVNNSNQLLPNFVEQISRQNHGKGNSKERSLVINPGGNMSPQKWWAKVLSRVQKLLLAILKAGEKNTLSSRTVVNKNVTVKRDVCTATHFQPFPLSFRKMWTESAGQMTIGCDKSTLTGKNAGQIDAERLASLTQILIPLLLECWVESRSSHDQTDISGSLLSQDALSVMVTILSVIQLLCECNETFCPENRRVFHEYLKDFQAHFMMTFPYSGKGNSAVFSKKKSDRQEQHLTVEMLNLAVCDVMTSFLPIVDSSMILLDPINEYLLTFHHKKPSFGSSTMQTWLKVVRRLLVLDPIYAEHQIHLIQGIMNRYKASRPLSAEKKIYFKFFTETILEDGFQLAFGDELVNEFLFSLPTLLRSVAKGNSNMSAIVLSTMHKAVSQGSHYMLDLLQTSMDFLLDPEGDVILYLGSVLQRSVIELLYSIQNITVSHLKLSRNLCFSLGFCKKNALYLLSVLNCRFQKCGLTSPSAVSRYFSFLLTLLIGKRCEEDGTGENIRTNGSDYHVDMYISAEVLDRHATISEKVCQMLHQMTNISQVQEFVSSFVEEYLIQNHYLSIMAVSGILLAVNRLCPTTCHDSVAGSNQELTILCCAVIYQMTVIGTTDLTKHLHALQQSTMECILSSSLRIKKCLETFCGRLNVCDTEEEVGSFVTAINYLLRDTEIRNAIHRTNCLPTLTMLSSDLQRRIKDCEEKQWWTDYSYLVSLVKT